MRSSFFVILLVCPFWALCQATWDSLGPLPKMTPIQTISPYDSTDDFEDLAFLKEVLKDKRIVMLGESLHGVEDFNEAKTRLVKFLHQEMDFEVLAFESELGCCELANSKKQQWSVEDILDYSIFRIWHTPASVELMRYIKKSPNLQLSGFDLQPQFYNDSLLVLPKFFEPVQASFAKKMLATEKALMSCYKNRPKLDKLKKVYLKALAKLETTKKIDKLYDARAIKLIKQVLTYRIAFVDRIIDYNIKPTKGGIARDSIMAENMEWLLNEYYPNKKIIVWAHNAHIAKMPTYPKAYMGKLLQQKWAKESYVMGFYYAIGKTCHLPTPERLENTEKTIKGNSVQYMIYKLNTAFGYINIREQLSNKWLNSVLQSIHVQYEWYYDGTKIRLTDNYDGLFICRKARCPDYLEGVEDYYSKFATKQNKE